VCYNDILDGTATTGYCTIVVLRSVVQGYTSISLENYVYYTMVVLKIIAQDCIVVVAQCYTRVHAYIVMLHVHPEPYMYLQTFL
jgi:hypothetical protein